MHTHARTLDMIQAADMYRLESLMEEIIFDIYHIDMYNKWLTGLLPTCDFHVLCCPVFQNYALECGCCETTPKCAVG